MTRLKLITFDGDVTLYPDGSTLQINNPVIPHLIDLLSQGIHIGIVTAAGYPEKHGQEYNRRLNGLLTAVSSSSLTPIQKGNLAILGGECNYLFRYSAIENGLLWVDEDLWRLDEMQSWQDHDVQLLLDIAEKVLRECAREMRLKVHIIRKPRAVGISPFFVFNKKGLVPDNMKLTRECLEEAVLASQRIISHHPVSLKIPFCCFNGGSDVWVDVGDKSLGVSVLQRYFHNTSPAAGDIWGGNTLHIGDQFMSLGGNDFKAVRTLLGVDCRGNLVRLRGLRIRGRRLSCWRS
jgi:IMP and pyridine-specific 5'-nucleotidase